MTTNIIEQDGIGLRYKNLVIQVNTQKTFTEVFIRSIRDFSMLNYLKIDRVLFYSSTVEDIIYLSHYAEEGYYKMDLLNIGIKKVESDIVPHYRWQNYTVCINKKEKRFEVFNGEDFAYKYKAPSRAAPIFSNSKIIEYSSQDKSNNWIKAISLLDNTELWTLDLEWMITRVEGINDKIIVQYQAYDNVRSDKGYEGKIDWFNPNYELFCINADTGIKEWSYPLLYNKIDEVYGAVLVGGPTTKIIDVETGTITEVKIINDETKSYLPFFVDKDGIYFISDSHSFGKISRDDGTILWEADLVDLKGVKRQIGDWLVAEDGKVCVRALPNHPNGELTCIIDPYNDN